MQAPAIFEEGDTNYHKARTVWDQELSVRDNSQIFWPLDIGDTRQGLRSGRRPSAGLRRASFAPERSNVMILVFSQALKLAIFFSLSLVLKQHSSYSHHC